jgi:hypothetical protein
MRRILLILLPLLALAGAPPNSARATPGASVASIAPADLVDPATLRASTGLVLRIPVPAKEWGRRAWQARAFARAYFGWAQAPVTRRHAPRGRSVGDPDFRAADALDRSGIHVWGTAAPPPFRPI